MPGEDEIARCTGQALALEASRDSEHAVDHRQEMDPGCGGILDCGLQHQIAELANSTRDCLPSSEGKLANMLTWRMRAGSRDVELAGWVLDPTVADGRAALACVTSRIGRTAGSRSPSRRRTRPSASAPGSGTSYAVSTSGKHLAIYLIQCYSPFSRNITLHKSGYVPSLTRIAIKVLEDQGRTNAVRRYLTFGRCVLRCYTYE